MPGEEDEEEDFFYADYVTKIVWWERK